MIRSKALPLVLILIIAAASTVASAGCHGERTVRSRVEQADRDRLVSDARTLYAKYRQDVTAEVPPAEWPQTIAAFEPKYVHVDNRGVYVCTHEVFVESAGLFIRMDESYDPPRRGDPGYELLAPNLYWYYAPG